MVKVASTGTLCHLSSKSTRGDYLNLTELTMQKISVEIRTEMLTDLGVTRAWKRKLRNTATYRAAVNKMNVK